MSGPIAAERLAATELGAAVDAVSPNSFMEGLKAVAQKLPVAVGVETVAIRLRDSDGEGMLHLVASEGIPASERRNPNFYVQSIAQARALFALKSGHSLARALGFTWLDGDWLKDGAEPLGTITVGSRTERRPTQEQRARLTSCAAELGGRLAGADRRTATLEELAQRAARESLLVPVEPPARVTKLLRPRELAILALYSEGLSASEIADVFVISPHTVRTHVKNAYRRLGIHSREEAARVIHSERFLELV
ncbi:MAG TPA: helix-turn-helix transcriptional regulator [Gaiellaceae bacterium]|jgi:DNA-binding CsgD family transcriptional regulator|nr:helix-turn-helix transcriptional regulator [Gaiellaceae bacterium]